MFEGRPLRTSCWEALGEKFDRSADLGQLGQRGLWLVLEIWSEGLEVGRSLEEPELSLGLGEGTPPGVSTLLSLVVLV